MGVVLFLSHDTLTQAVAGTLAGAITFLGRILTFGALYGPVTRDNRRGGALPDAWGRM